MRDIESRYVDRLSIYNITKTSHTKERDNSESRLYTNMPVVIIRLWNWVTFFTSLFFVRANNNMARSQAHVNISRLPNGLQCLVWV